MATKLSNAIVVVAMFLGNVALAHADIINLELPQLNGDYAAGSRTVSFDLGTMFQSINTVQLRSKGSSTPGTLLGDGVERPINPPFPWPASFSVTMDPDPGVGLWTVSTGLLDGPFELNEPFTSFPTPQSWDFLLDGRADMTIVLSPAIVIGGGSVISFPVGEVTEASLTVDGTVVSEPPAFLLLVLGAVGMLARLWTTRWRPSAEYVTLEPSRPIHLGLATARADNQSSYSSRTGIERSFASVPRVFHPLNPQRASRV